MSKPLTVAIPHNLGKEEALRRIQSGLATARSRFASHLVVREDAGPTTISTSMSRR